MALAYLMMVFICLSNAIVASTIFNGVVDAFGAAVWLWLSIIELRRLKKLSAKTLVIEYQFTHTEYSTILKIREALDTLTLVEKIETKGNDTLLIHVDPEIHQEISLKIGVMIGTLETQDRSLKIIDENFRKKKYEVDPSQN